MTTQTTTLPLLGTLAGFRRFSVNEYHRLTEIGFLTEDDDLELLEGYLIHKMARNPPHDGTLHRTSKRLARILGDRADKGRIYARAGLACYGIINLPDRQIEVYTSPSGSATSAGYGQRQDFKAGDVLPISLDGQRVATISVHELLP